MFGMGMPEMLVIMVVALVVLGPKRLPELARTLGKAMAEFRRQTTDIMDEFQQQARVDEEAARRPKPRPTPRTDGETPKSET
jgi:Tat protein translocase TatB subunit